MSTSSEPWWYIVGTILTIGLLIVIGFIIYKIKAKRKIPQNLPQMGISTIEKIYKNEPQSSAAISTYQNVIVELSTNHHEEIVADHSKMTHIDSPDTLNQGLGQKYQGQGQKYQGQGHKYIHDQAGHGHDNPTFQIEQADNPSKVKTPVRDESKITPHKFNINQSFEHKNIDSYKIAGKEGEMNYNHDILNPRNTQEDYDVVKDLQNDSERNRAGDSQKLSIERNVAVRRTVSEMTSQYNRAENFAHRRTPARSSTSDRRQIEPPVAPRRKKKGDLRQRQRYEPTKLTEVTLDSESISSEGKTPQIPNPDYTLHRKKLIEAKHHSPKVPIKPREFRGPYGLDDLDEMNNPYTWGKKPVGASRPPLLSNQEWI